MINAVRAFFAFLYDFIVGDDWRIAVAVVLALAATSVLAAATTIPAWWVIPAAVAIVLPASLWRASRAASVDIHTGNETD